MNPMTLIRRVVPLLLAMVLAGCATTASNTANNPRDPFEGFNRAMFDFNDALDRNALKPTAEAYQAVVPEPVQTGIGNFFSNLGDVWTGVNNFLQGKPKQGAQDFTRFAINSTIGIAGVFDIATQAGIPKHKEDFGQTLGRWGVTSGPYVVLPLLGSSTLRDTVAMPLDWKGDLWQYKEPARWRNVGSVVKLVDARASVLDASNLLEEAALDRYEFVRDAYLQRRQSIIDDGDEGEKRAEPFHRWLLKYLRPGQKKEDGKEDPKEEAKPAPEAAAKP